LIKGLARAGCVDKAMEVYRHMHEQSPVKPDTIMFSVLIKANCDSGRMEGALRLFESMIELGYRPDEIVFNTLLAGCVRDSNLGLGRKLLDDMAQIGVRPSSVTVSVLIKLYAKCHTLDDAQRLIQRMPDELGLVPEPRLYTQLIQACIRERQGRRAVEVYRLMTTVMRPDTSTNSSILSMCLNFNMADTALELSEAAREVGSEVLECDQGAVYQALEKKGRCARQADVVGGIISTPMMAAAPSAQTQRRSKYRSCYCGP